MMRAALAFLLVFSLTSLAAAADKQVVCNEDSPYHDPVCNTPRPFVVSGFYLGVDLGYTSADSVARRKVGLGGGRPLEFRLGLEFWDHLILELGLGRLGFKDLDPSSVKVMDCTKFMSATLDCDEDNVYDKKSSVAAFFLSYQLGVQHRFRTSKKSSLVPGVMFGYQHSPRGAKRSVTCEGCPKGDSLDIDLNGMGVTPFLRLTLSGGGNFGLIARSRWFFTGDLKQQTTLGLEFGLP